MHSIGGLITLTSEELNRAISRIMIQKKSGHTMRNSKTRRPSPPQRFSGTASSRAPSFTEVTTAPVVRKTGRKDASQCHPYFPTVAPAFSTPEHHMNSPSNEDPLPSAKPEIAAPTHGTFGVPDEESCPISNHPKRQVSGPDSAGGGTASFDGGNRGHGAPREVSVLITSASPRHMEMHNGKGGDKQTHADNPKSLPNIEHQIARSAPTPSSTDRIHGPERRRGRATHIRSKGRSSSDRRQRGRRLTRAESNASTRSSFASSPADTADLTRHSNIGGSSSKKCVSNRCSLGTPGTTTGASGCRVLHFEGMNTTLLEEAFTFADKMAEREKLEKLEKQREQQSTSGQNHNFGRGGSGGLSPRHDSRRSLPWLRSSSNRPWCNNTVRATQGGCTRGNEPSTARKLASPGPKKGSSAFSVRTAAGVSALSAPKPSNLSIRNQNWIESHHHFNRKTEECGSGRRHLDDNNTRGAGQGKSTTLCQDEKPEEISLKGTTEQRQQTTDVNRAETTASLLQHFESGAGIAALKLELQESQASLKKATEAIGEAATRWRRLRQLN